MFNILRNSIEYDNIQFSDIENINFEKKINEHNSIKVINSYFFEIDE